MEAVVTRLIGAGCKNYAVERVQMLASLCADLPRHLAYIATHNRTVNMEGKSGRGKPIDQLNDTQHVNFFTKCTLKYVLYVHNNWGEPK